MDKDKQLVLPMVGVAAGGVGAYAGGAALLGLLTHIITVIDGVYDMLVVL